MVREPPLGLQNPRIFRCSWLREANNRRLTCGNQCFSLEGRCLPCWLAAKPEDACTVLNPKTLKCVRPMVSFPIQFPHALANCTTQWQTQSYLKIESCDFTIKIMTVGFLKPYVTSENCQKCNRTDGDWMSWVCTRNLAFLKQMFHLLHYQSS